MSQEKIERWNEVEGNLGSQQRLQAFLDSANDSYAILQLRRTDETTDERFMSYDYLKSKGKKTRINTNGQAELIIGAGVPEKLKGRIDTVNVSLNATSAKAYQDLCHSEFGEKAFYAMLDFAKACKQYVPRVVLSVVDVVGEDEIAKAHEIAKALGVELRVRHYVQ